MSLKILCVDDDRGVLEVLVETLQGDYEVVTAARGARALELLSTAGPFAVLICDMRMPEMDGAEVLASARKLAPEVVRVVLTGQAELDAAVNAVNRGQIFRFLLKPCPPKELRSAVRAAVLQHKLASAEKVLLEQTLRGAVKALTDVLALSDPAAFGRAPRVRRLAEALSGGVDPAQRWHIEVAAMLAQLGAVSLPPSTLASLAAGAPLDAAEQAMVARAAEVCRRLIAGVPRLEIVQGMLALYPRATAAGEDDLVGVGARILRVAVDYEALEAGGMGSAAALAAMRARAGSYDPALLDALAALPRGEARTVPVAELRDGMVLAADVRLPDGRLLAGRGLEVGAAFIERARNCALAEVRVIG